MADKGLLIVVSGPAGTGKGTVLGKLISGSNNIKHSVSVTTRDMRKNDIDGISYYFKTREQFDTMVTNNEFLEWDEYCGNKYGTPEKEIKEGIEKGLDVILELTVSGALAVKKSFPECVTVFILPPSLTELERRIRNRNTETDVVIRERMKKARHEILYINEYNYVIINDEFDAAVDRLKAIILAEKSRYERNKNILEINGFNQEVE